jgi:aspartate/methionine/tyrosine aminotransferase
MGVLAGEGALDVFVRARALESAGRTIVHLELGEPDFPTPQHIVDAGVRALRDGETRYTPPAGLSDLREAIATALARRGVATSADEIVVAPGAKPVVFYAVLSLVGPGDEVLVPDPGFPIYPSVVRFAGGTPVPYGLVETSRFLPDVDEIEARITPRTRVLILNAPHNPTGGSVDHATLARIAELVERHDLTVISDEVYAAISYDDTDFAPSVAAAPELKHRTILVDGFSKRFAMTGWRLGYGVIPAPIVPAFVTLTINGHTCTPAFVQRAALAALTGPAEPVRAMVAEYRRRRDLIVPGLATIPGVSCAAPAGAFYAFPNVSAVLRRAGLSTTDFADRLLEDFGVAALSGTAFGSRGEGHLRLSFAASRAALEAALAAFRDCVESLTPLSS